jgi:hypothetical protein
MLKELCATLLVLCNPILSGFDFDYAKDDRDQFVQGITECTIKYNTDITPFERAIVVISVAQAIIESNWGESRFAREANNFYGVIQTDRTEPHIKSLRCSNKQIGRGAFGTGSQGNTANKQSNLHHKQGP